MSLRLHFEGRYLLGHTPWDTGITPPEVLAFLEGRPPGRALDIGCGTGTNALTLARLGWSVTAVDFSSLALWAARRKARAATAWIDFRQADASRFDGLVGPFDFAMDIGCFHSLAPASRAGYASRLPELLAPGAGFLLFCFLAHPDRRPWPSRAEIEDLFSPAFRPLHVDVGEYSGLPSAYFSWERRS
ncbi:MAG TPA: methyltransferase domain-containing protein [Anaerolineales bacterium]|nr:methyltransferase domain-containing protein [Anaerolineales bacterium]